MRTIVNKIELALKLADDKSPRSVEGLDNATGVLMDYGDVIVHVFLSETQDFYDLDRHLGRRARGQWTALPGLHVGDQVRSSRYGRIGTARSARPSLAADSQGAVEAGRVQDRADDRRLRAARGEPVGDVVDRPPPPDAMTGTFTASATARVMSRS